MAMHRPGMSIYDIHSHPQAACRARSIASTVAGTNWMTRKKIGSNDGCERTPCKAPRVL